MCQSQYYTRPVFGEKQSDVVYILKNIKCTDVEIVEYEEGTLYGHHQNETIYINETHGWLYEFYSGDLLYYGVVRFEKYNLREYLCDTEIVEISESMYYISSRS